jgi:rubrerythrin
MQMDIIEFLQKAISDEKVSETHYRKFAEDAEDPETRAMLESLAEDELKHQRVLKEKMIALKLKRAKGQ